VSKTGLNLSGNVKTLGKTPGVQDLSLSSGVVFRNHLSVIPAHSCASRRALCAARSTTVNNRHTPRSRAHVSTIININPHSLSRSSRSSSTIGWPEEKGTLCAT